MKAIMISGSRNPKGQTATAADAFLAGLGERGAECSRVFLPERKIERCRQCDDRGWGICRTEGRCVIDDDMPALVEQLVGSDAVVFANPVYFGDLSESLRAFLDRLRRTCMHESGKARVSGKPAVGICVAGGGGGGAPECCARLNSVLATCGFNVLDMIPVRRQNLDAKLPVLKESGRWSANQVVKA